MNTPDSLNSSRPYDPMKSERCNALKEMLNEKEEKLKELMEKNERLEKDCLKFQIQIKNVEDKLKAKAEKEYVTNTNTSSNFLLPSEFRKIWEDLANQSLSDCFIDFYDNPILSYHLIQEIFILSYQLFKEQIKNLVIKILDILNIPKEKNNQKVIENSMKCIFQEYFNNIFESEKNAETFLTNIIKEFQHFAENEMKDFKKQEELEDMIKSKSFKDMISLIKKILLYIEFHNPPLTFKIDSFKERKIETKKFKSSEVICVEGHIKDEKTCLILLNPPVMKNGFFYNGLKPVVMVYEGNNSQPEKETNLNNTNVNISSSNINNVVSTDPTIPLIKNTSTPTENKTISHFNNNFVNPSNANYHINVNLKQFLKDSNNTNKSPSKSNSILNNSPADFNSNNSLTNVCAEKKLATISSSQKNFLNKKLSVEKVLNISDSLNFEMKINKSKEITFLKNSNEKEKIVDLRDRIKNSFHEVEKNLEKKFNLEILNNPAENTEIINKSNNKPIHVPNTENNVSEKIKNPNRSIVSEKSINSSAEKESNTIKKDKKIRQISLDAANINSNNSFNMSYNNITVNQNNSNGEGLYNNINKLLANQLDISDHSEGKNSFNYRSTSHHNLFSSSASANKKHKNSNTKNTQNSKEYPSVSKTSFGERNSHLQNLNGIITGNISTIKEIKLRSYEKSENIIQSSRSHFESNNEEYLENLDQDDETDQNLDDNDNDFDFDNIQLGTEYNYPKETNKIISSMLSNSFTVNKKSDLINTMSQINLNSIKLNDRDGTSNPSEFNSKNKSGKGKITNILINNSDKKLNKGNFYLYQSTERGPFDMSSLTKTIDKLGSKVNPIFFRSGFKKTMMRSLSKTPKQNKPRVIGYSPRTNIHYIFNDKQNLPNNFIIKVANKKSVNSQKYLNNLDEKINSINSKNSSVSRERKSQTNLLYQTHKTLEDDKDKDHRYKNSLSNPVNDIYKYKEFVKGKIKVSNTTSNSNTNNNTNNNIFTGKVACNSNNIVVIPVQQNQQQQQNLVKNNKNNISYQKTTNEDNFNKKKIIQKDNSHNSAKKTSNKSIDRRVLTNAQTKLCVDELLSFKKTDKNRGSPTNGATKEKNLETKYSKTNFLNIKYV